MPALVTAWAGAAAVLYSANAIGKAGVGLIALAALVLAGLVAAAGPKQIPEALVAQIALCLSVLAIVSGSTAVRLSGREPIGALTEAVTLEAVVAGIPHAAGPGKRWQGTVELDARLIERGNSPATSAQFRVVALGSVAQLQRGEIVRVSGRLQPLPPSSDAAALIFEAEVIEVAPAEGAAGMLAAARSAFLTQTSDLDSQGRALVPGITLGDDSRLSSTLEAAMRRTSLGHLTAVSGSHVSLVLVALAFMLGRLSRRTRVAGAAIGLAALVALVGPEPSVVRAAAMGSVGILALSRGRPPQAFPTLAGGLVVALTLDPWLALQLGFALSAAATASILLFSGPLAVAIVGPDATGKRKALGLALAVPVAASLACAPILVLMAPEVSLIGVAANALAAPAVAPATVLGLGGVILAVPLPAGAKVLAQGAAIFTGWIAGVAQVGARLPFAAIPWPGGIAGAALLALLNASLLAVLLSRRHRCTIPAIDLSKFRLAEWRTRTGGLPVVVFGLAVVGLGVVSVVVGNLVNARPWAVWQCDVGQGAALLVSTGEHSAIMVDVGPAEGRSQDCLARAGVRRLDLLVLTHPHADHIGNLPAVLASVPVGRVLVSEALEPAESVAWVDEEVRAAGLSPEPTSAGMQGSSGAVSWQILWPVGQPAGLDTNELSLAVGAWFPGGSVLALGDLGVPGQQGLVTALGAAGYARFAAVTVPHHGAKAQLEELAAMLQPEVALISVGQNTYGHPTSAAIDLYSSLGARLLRTDQLGDISIAAPEAWDY